MKPNLIIGIEKQEIAKIQPSGYTCISCGSTNSTSLSLYSNYFHILRVPFFPLTKKCTSHCDQCLFSASDGELSVELFEDSIKLRSIHVHPFWTFSGTALTILFSFLFLMVSIVVHVSRGHNSATNSKRDDLHVQPPSNPMYEGEFIMYTPAKGDVFEYENRIELYTTFIVDSLLEDSILIRHNRYVTTKPYKLKDEYFGTAFKDTIDTMSKEEFKSLCFRRKILRRETSKK